MPKATDPFYLSPAWFKARHQCLSDHRFCCARCGVDVRGKGKAIIHHKIPRRQAPHLELDRTNLEPMCKPCHGHTHGLHGEVRMQSVIGVDGYPVDGEWGQVGGRGGNREDGDDRP